MAKSANAGIEWLDLTFPKAVTATGLRISESNASGTIVKVELCDDKSAPRLLWSGTTDPTRGLNCLMLAFAPTICKANRAKITLATNLSPGCHEIGAVQLLGSDK